MSAVHPGVNTDSDVRRLRALNQLLVSISSARGLDDVYEAAITSLLDTTAADRAAILLYDDDGVIRFKASHGLSDAYQTAVTGHCPWKRGEQGAQPVVVADVFQDDALASYRDLFRQENIGALVFIPLGLEAGVFGKFMLYYREPHECGLQELEIAQAIAAHVSLATERERTEQAHRRIHQQLQAILDNSGAVIFVKDLDGRYVLVNRQYEEAIAPKPKVLGHTDHEVFPNATAEHYRANDRAVLEAGKPLAFEESAQQSDGVHTYVSVKFPVQGPDGSAAGVGGIAADISDRKRLEHQLLLLLEASGSLLAKPSSKDVLPTVVELGRRFIAADAYGVWRQRPGEDIWDLASSAGLSERFIAGGTVTAAGTVPPEEAKGIEDIGTDPLLARRLHSLIEEGVRSMLITPLRISGHTSGTLVFYWNTPRKFTPAEIRLAGIIGNLAASALGTAELYERQLLLRERAEAAQRHATFLAQAGALLASSLDYQQTLASVAKLAVPTFADWAGVDLITESGVLQRVAVMHADPEKVRFGYEFHRRYPPRENEPALAALRTGRSIMMPELPDELIDARARSAEHAADIRKLGLKSFIVAPMMFGEKYLGTITFATAESGRVYNDADRQTAEELARRAAIAVQHARLHRDIRDSEERFRAIVETTPELVKLIAPDGTVLQMNPAGLRMLGAKSAADVIGQNVYDVIAPEFRETYRAFNERICSGQKGSLEFDVIGFTGERRHMETVAAPFLRPDGSTAHLAVTHDVTNRKRTEAALLSSERRFRQLADAMPQIVWTARPDGCLDYYNERWYEFSGFPRGQFGDSSWKPILHPEDVQRCHDGWYRSVATGQPYHVELRFWDRTEKRWRWFIGRALPVRDAGERIVKWFGTCTDIDDQKRVEDDLRRANQDLEQFAYSASHDLQEPLRSIKIYSELLTRRYGDGLDAQAREFLNFVREGGSRMEKLVRDLLDYTQVLQLNLPREETDANAVLSVTLANLEGAIAGSGACVTSDPLPCLRMHSTHLQQLFQNLVGNAIKYRSPERAPMVHISAERQNASWVVAVRDNGIGIDPQYKDRIFGLFKRLHTGDEYSGTGIGLAICQRIVDRYEGAIEVESELGIGSTFRFRLPV